MNSSSPEGSGDLTEAIVWSVVYAATLQKFPPSTASEPADYAHDAASVAAKEAVSSWQEFRSPGRIEGTDAVSSKQGNG